MKKFKFLILLAFLSVSITSFSQIDYEQLKSSGYAYINANNLMKTDEYFASSELEGRLAGSEGFYKAVNYASDIFKNLGLVAPFSNSYYQKFFTEYNEIKPPCKLYLIISDIEKKVEGKIYHLGKDFVCRQNTGSGTFEAPVVFVGYGIDDKETGYNDYENVDVKGKIVLMFKQEPDWLLNFGGSPNLRFRANLAAQKGAIAVILVSKPNDKNPQKPIGSVLDGAGEHLDNLPILHVNLNVAKDFLSESGYALKDLQTQIDSSKKPVSIYLKKKIKMEIHSYYTKEKETMNVVGVLEGSDSLLKNECVVIGAHLDHVGQQAGEIYFPGANDNASGSSAVIEIAKAFVNSGIKPKRTIVFILFSNEESGLQGSQYYTDNPLFPLNKTVAMLNLDCIGFGDSIQVGNGESVQELWKIANKNDSLFTKMMVKRTWKDGGADATPFHKKNIPCLYFVSTNSYEHLHLTTDKPETLNKSLFEKVTKLAFLTLFDVSNGDYIREPINGYRDN